MLLVNRSQSVKNNIYELLRMKLSKFKGLPYFAQIFVDFSEDLLVSYILVITCVQVAYFTVIFNIFMADRVGCQG